MIKRDMLYLFLAMVAAAGPVGATNAVVGESKGEKKQGGPNNNHVEVAASNSLPRVRYKVADLGTLGGPRSEAFAINNAGQIVGSSETHDRRGFSHAFLYSAGKMIDLGVLEGHSQSQATGINKQGVIVGRSESFCGCLVNSYSFVYWGGLMHPLELESGQSQSVLVSSINDAGHYVGLCRGPHACFYDGATHDLGVLRPEGARSEALGINNSDEVVGVSWISNAGDTRAFLWRKGEMLNLGTLPGYYRSNAQGINNHGQIVGWSARPYKVSPDPCAFIYSQGRMRDLNEAIPANSGWIISKANGINDAGQIVGEGVHGSKHHAVLLSPAALK